jgi:hypothetical protein
MLNPHSPLPIARRGNPYAYNALAQDLDPQKMVELTEARDQLRREVDKAKEDAGERAKALQQAQQVSPAAAFVY